MDGRGPLRLGVLGEIVAARDSAALPMGGRRQRAVLAALVMARGEAVPADRLVECVWGETPPANPAGTLQSYVSHLRRALEPEVGARSRSGVIASSGTGYALRLPEDAVDAWRFEQAVTASPGSPPDRTAAVLDAALRLWRGPAYADYADEPWARAEVARLTELRHLARERLLGARLDVVEAALLVGELEALVADDPLREERWRLLVLALYRAQRQADALAALRRARATLRESLGVDPGPALRLLEEQVLAQASSLERSSPHRPPAPVTSADGRPARVAARPAPGPEVLRERESELRRLESAVAALAGRRGGLVLVEGPAGIGKTALLGAATTLAAGRGLPVLAARSSRLEQSFGFGVVRQLLEPALGDAERRDLLLRGAAAARGVLDDPVDSGGAEGTFAVLHALYRLTATLGAEAPLLIAVDDLQWCDSASLRYLVYLGRRLEGLPIAIAATIRTGEEHPEPALIHELVLDPAATTMAPRPLSRHATHALVAERLGDPEAPFVTVCQATTAGNPLLLRQLLRALEAAGVRPDVSHVDTVRAIGSRAVASLVTLRLRRLAREATPVARAVAVVGQHADLPTIAAFAGFDEERTAAMLDVLTRAEILDDHQPPGFVHPLVRDAVYHDQPAGERALHHERAARLLHERGAPLQQVATHLLLAPRRGDPATVALLRAAATTAAERGATESAVTLLRRAADEPATGPERTELLVQLGSVEALVDGPAAVAHLCEAYERLDDPRRRAEIALVVTRTHLFASPPGTATAFARDAAAALPAELDDARQGLQALQRISGHMHGLPPQQYRTGRPTVAGCGVGARMLAATLAYERLLDGQDRAEAVRLARFALEDDDVLVADSGLLWVAAAVVLVLSDADLGDFWDRAMTRAERTGSLFAVLSVNLWRGFTEWRRGQLDHAQQSIQDALEQGRMWGGSQLSRAYATAFAAGVLVDRDEIGAAERLLRETSALPDLGEGTRLLREAAVRVLLARDEPERALQALVAAVEPPGTTNPAWSAWRRLKAGALARLGRREEALALADAEVALLRRWGAPTQLGAALRARGALHARAPGPGPDASADSRVADYREAVALLSCTDSTLELARACLSLGREPATPAADAVPLLGRALDLAVAGGAGGVRREAVAALRSRGVPVPAACAAPGTPTARHRQAQALAARGLGVAEISQRMFLSPGTVERLLGEVGLAAGWPDAAPGDQDAASQPQVPPARLPPSRPWSTT